MTSAAQTHSASAVLVAAGNSTRLERADGTRKPFVEVEGRSVLEHVMASFDRCSAVGKVVIVAQQEDLQRIEDLAGGHPLFAKLHAVVAGGAERTDSVLEGVRATPEDCSLVAIHDAARLLIRSETIAAAIECAALRGAALVAIPVQDTIKRSADGVTSDETLERSELWAAQTPQVFRRGEILELLERAASEGSPPTDDAALYERWIGPIPIVRGDSSNLKLTTPTDLEVVGALLRQRSQEGSRS